MSVAILFDRKVVVRRVGLGAENPRGNATAATTDVADVPAFRVQVGADEETADRDQQARTFVYLLPVFLDDGTELELTGRDRIVDDLGGPAPVELQVVGTPVVVTSRGRPKHVEARAYFVG